MSEFATPTNTNNPIMNPIVYFRVSAFALLAVAILGTVMAIIYGGDNTTAKDQLLAFGGVDGLGFTWAHNVLHFVLAGACFLFGFGNLAGNVVKIFAIIFGFVYASLGVLGFFVANPLGDGAALALNTGIALSAVHLLLGAWALVSGFGSRFD